MAYDISVVIATFNSSNTLGRTLESIRNQNFPQKKIEIIIVDGGSSDDTISIARSYGCLIVKNPKVEPLYAKYTGYLTAKGRYLLYLDHDEELLNPDSLKYRLKMFRQNPNVKAATGYGYVTPDGYQIINRYINEFGDPFSYFIYRLSKHINFFIPTMTQRYTILKNTPEYILFDLASSTSISLIELGAGGGMLDAAYFRKQYPHIKNNYHLIPHFLHLLREDFPALAVMKHDGIMHYSSDNLSGYIQKILWRIKNNIFFTGTIGASGFIGREKYQPMTTRLKKYIFIPYAFTLIFPLIDSIRLIISRKDLSYGIHIVLTVITAVLMVYYSFLKIIGYRPQLTSYDGSTKAYEHS